MDAYSRRRMLSTTGCVVGVALAGCLGGGASGDGEAPYDGWLDGANNAETVVDRTDTEHVSVGVGAPSPYAFDPAAVRITPGTTVVWEWSGRGSSHNVVAMDGTFESDYYLEEGESFSHTFDSPGVYKYHCTPHQTQGMLGVVEVVEP